MKAAENKEKVRIRKTSWQREPKLPKMEWHTQR